MLAIHRDNALMPDAPGEDVDFLFELVHRQNAALLVFVAASEAAILAAIDAKIRAFTPWPGAFTGALGTTLKIHQAKVYQQELPAHIRSAYPEAPVPGTVLGMDKAHGILVQTGDGILCITNLQWQAKKAMSWKDFMNGSPNFAGCCCSSN